LPIRVTASFGMAWLMPNSDISENLIARADAALYAAKNAGRNRVGYAPFEPNSVTPAADTGRKAPNETQTA
jgi:predicted signal transduction protein with EAL and GGDEF domain